MNYRIFEVCQGDSTDFNDELLYKINVNSNLTRKDLEPFKAIVEIEHIRQEYDVSEGYFFLQLTGEETGSLDLGNHPVKIRMKDSQGRLRTVHRNIVLRIL